MKNQIFTIVLMLTLVALTGKVFAQSTPVAPYEGAIHTYVVDGLTENDLFEFGINTVEGDYSSGGSFYSITSANSGSVGPDGTASLTVEWQAESAAAGIYYVWIRIEDSEGCSTYRYLSVDPVPGDLDDPYDVYFNVLALLAGDDDTTPLDVTSETGAVTLTDICPAFVGHDWESSVTEPYTSTDGSSYVYFRIERSSVAWPSTAWEITAASTTSATWAISYDNAASFSAYTMGTEITPINTGNFVYLRATVANDVVAQSIDLSISDGNDIAQTAETVNYTNSSATLTLDPLPTVGGFGSSF